MGSIGDRARNSAIYRKWEKCASMTGVTCHICGAYTLYSFEYDASFCPLCNDWREKACSDPECCYCSKRPDTPEEYLYTPNYLAEKQKIESAYVDEARIKRQKRRWNKSKKSLVPKYRNK